MFPGRMPREGSLPGRMPSDDTYIGGSGGMRLLIDDVTPSHSMVYCNCRCVISGHIWLVLVCNSLFPG